MRNKAPLPELDGTELPKEELIQRAMEFRKQGQRYRIVNCPRWYARSVEREVDGVFSEYIQQANEISLKISRENIQAKFDAGMTEEEIAEEWLR